MSRTGLGRFGIVPATVVRLPTRDRDDLVICPECGKPVGASKGSPIIYHPDDVDDYADVIGDTLITHGWTCTRHQYDVVLPVRGGLNDRWTSVSVRFADEAVRDVPVPEKELTRSQEEST